MHGARLARQHDIVWAASDCDPVPSAGDRPMRSAPMRSANTIENLTGLPFPIWGPGSLVRLWRETRAADAVHLHDFMYLGNWAAFVFATLRGKPLLITQHVGFIPYRSSLLRFVLRALHASLGRVMLGRADQVVFISRPVRHYYQRFVRFRKPPSVIANGVDVQTFVPSSAVDQAPARSALGLDPARPVLLFVGRFVEKKGLHILERLAKRLTNVSWAFAGRGPLDPGQWGCPHVHIFRDRHGAELVPLYQAADILVLPSVGEGLPLVIQEAMSCGTPVITGEDTAEAVDAPSEFVFSCGVGGAETANNWEAALGAILGERESLSARRHAIAQFARSKWSWEVCAAAYEATLRELTTHCRANERSE